MNGHVLGYAKILTPPVFIPFMPVLGFRTFFETFIYHLNQQEPSSVGMEKKRNKAFCDRWYSLYRALNLTSWGLSGIS